MHDIVLIYLYISISCLLFMFVISKRAPQNQQSIFFWLQIKTFAAIVVNLFAWQFHWFDRVIIAGHEFRMLALYMDWLITTPITLVLILKWLQWLTEQTFKTNLMKTLIGLNLGMIAFGFLAEWVQNSLWLRWCLFGGAGVMMIGIWTVMYRESHQLHKTHSERCTFEYRFIVNLVMCFWMGFPLIWLLSPFGMNWISIDFTLMLFWLLNSWTKLVFLIVILGKLRDLKVRSGLELD
jgi:bacteriorhodopsin